MTSQVISLETLTKSARLSSVDMVSCLMVREHSSNVGNPLSLPDKLDIRITQQLMSPKESPADRTSFVAGVQCEWSASGKASGKLEVSFRLAYQFAGALAVSNDVIREFGQKMAMHHAWPFLRERVRTLSVELGFPVVILPLRHLGPAQPQRKRSTKVVVVKTSRSSRKAI